MYRSRALRANRKRRGGVGVEELTVTNVRGSCAAHRDRRHAAANHQEHDAATPLVRARVEELRRRGGRTLPLIREDAAPFLAVPACRWPTSSESRSRIGQGIGFDEGSVEGGVGSFVCAMRVLCTDAITYGRLAAG